jgi:hypothetical protein
VESAKGKNQQKCSNRKKTAVERLGILLTVILDNSHFLKTQ